MKKLISLTSALVLGLFLVSCDDDEDSSADTALPTIQSVSYEGTNVTSVDEFEVHIGEELGFDIVVADNEGLSQLSVDIHDAFDGHTHDHAKLLSTDDGDTLTYTQIYNLTGTTATQHVHVMDQLTEDYLHGHDHPYHLELVVLDAAGNRAEKVLTFEIHDEGGEGDGDGHNHDHQ